MHRHEAQLEIKQILAISMLGQRAEELYDSGSPIVLHDIEGRPDALIPFAEDSESGAGEYELSELGVLEPIIYGRFLNRAPRVFGDLVLRDIVVARNRFKGIVPAVILQPGDVAFGFSFELNQNTSFIDLLARQMGIQGVHFPRSPLQQSNSTKLFSTARSRIAQLRNIQSSMR